MYTVLLADDEMLALEGLQTLIDWQSCGFEVTAVAQDGAQALEKLRAVQPDLVVTDLYMPVLDGLGLMETARAEEFKGEFLIVSGYSDFEYARRALSLRAAGYLLKPIDTEEAEATVRSVFQKLERRISSTRAQEAFCDYRGRVTRALCYPWDSSLDIPSESNWQLITWQTPIPYEASLALVEAASRQSVTASLHMVREHEWLVLQSADAIPQELLEIIADQVRRQGREVRLLPRDLKPEQFYEACMSNSCLQKPEPESLTEEQKTPTLAEVLPREKLNRLSDRKQRESAVAALLRMADEPGWERLTLESAAQQIGYNTVYLGRLFQKEMHQSFQNYLKNRRLTRTAQALLANPETTAQDLAEQAGFYDYSTFYKSFKSKYGCSPEQYRQKYLRP